MMNYTYFVARGPACSEPKYSKHDPSDQSKTWMKLKHVVQQLATNMLAEVLQC